MHPKIVLVKMVITMLKVNQNATNVHINARNVPLILTALSVMN